MSLREINFDGIVGPSHNYAGLSLGNIASASHRGDASFPRAAALQGIAKMRGNMERGLAQGFLLPLPRPNRGLLHDLAAGPDSDRALIAAAWSASSMWTANAATVCSSADSIDGKVHFVPANLRAKPHRAIEPYNTKRALQRIFSDESCFVVHDPLELGDGFSDEGAANHTRFEFDGQGFHFFVYGREALNNSAVLPMRFPARQTLEASSAVARVNQVKPGLCYFTQQNPNVIDAGVFHNDVISVGHGNVLLYHELSFLDTDRVIGDLHERSGGKLIPIKVTSEQVDLKTAVQTYLFNSQIVTLPEGHMALVAPKHCEEDQSVKAFIDQMVADESNPINEVMYFDLLQSMKNGGGPACLRLRVQLTDGEVAKVNPKCLLTDGIYKELCHWVERNYREELTLKDIVDSRFIEESTNALIELQDILGLGQLYKLDQ